MRDAICWHQQWGGAEGKKKKERKKGYNLIRMRIVSGYLPVNVRDYYRVEMLPGCITLPRLK